MSDAVRDGEPGAAEGADSPENLADISSARLVHELLARWNSKSGSLDNLGVPSYSYPELDAMGVVDLLSLRAKIGDKADEIQTNLALDPAAAVNPISVVFSAYKSLYLNIMRILEIKLQKFLATILPHDKLENYTIVAGGSSDVVLTPLMRLLKGGRIGVEIIVPRHKFLESRPKGYKHLANTVYGKALQSAQDNGLVSDVMEIPGGEVAVQGSFSLYFVVNATRLDEAQLPEAGVIRNAIQEQIDALMKESAL